MRHPYHSSPLPIGLLSGLLALVLSTVRATPASAQVASSPSSSPMVLTAPSAEAASEDVFAPRGNLLELGLFGGLLFVSDRNALHDPARPFANFRNPVPEIGLRLAYFPLSFLGAEAEFAVGAAGLDGGENATTWAGRGHLILQAPTRRVVPFALVGGGRMGISSDLAGEDDDPAFHFGAGLKFNLHRRVALRLEARDTITRQRPASDTAHHFELLAGVSLVFGRPKPRPLDTDRDGVIDLQDQCPMEAGTPPDGCPIRDADGDGILDPQDQCPAEAGIEPTGCPVRDADGDGVEDDADECANVAGIPPTGCPDGDGDGILDRDDRCLDEVGVAPDGCPPDSDGDGFVDPRDQCPNEAENVNGFQDEDGCPDQIPDVVKKFTGVIRGINFEKNKAEIVAGSRPLLDEAAAVLIEYPTLKVMVVGHTDSSGSRDYNVTLSQQRADSVKTYLVEHGVSAERIMTRGEGPDQPIADNASRAGRQKNRRIEFTIIK